MLKVQTRKEKKEQTRLKLVDSGMSIFAERGFSATTMTEIASNVSVAHGTVFLHFPKREDLIVAVLDEFGTRLSEAFEEGSKKKESLRGVLEAHLGVLKTYEAFYARIIKEEAYLPSQVQSLFLMLHAAVSQKIHLAAEKENIRKIPRHLLFNTWISLVHYYISHKELFAPRGSVIDEKGSEILNHFMNLVRK